MLYVVWLTYLSIQWHRRTCWSISSAAPGTVDHCPIIGWAFYSEFHELLSLEIVIGCEKFSMTVTSSPIDASQHWPTLLRVVPILCAKLYSVVPNGRWPSCILVSQIYVVMLYYMYSLILPPNHLSARSLYLIQQIEKKIDMIINPVRATIITYTCTADRKVIKRQHHTPRKSPRFFATH